MKIALLGYGRMGKAIEKIAEKRGHEIVAKIDKNNPLDSLNNADVAINFSVPNAALANITNALNVGIPVVCGTTGWLDHKKKLMLCATNSRERFCMPPTLVWVSTCFLNSIKN